MTDNTNCYLNMKIPQSKNRPLHPHSNKQNFAPCQQYPPTSANADSYLEYYPNDHSKHQSHMKIEDGISARIFFSKFDKNCRVTQERVQFEKRIPHKKLVEVLTPMMNTPLRNTKQNNPEFSFKKGDPLSTNHTKKTTETIEKPTVYYLQPKYRLRKFQSVTVLRTSTSQREGEKCEGQRVQLRKNCSVAKYQMRNYRKEESRARQGVDGQYGVEDRRVTETFRPKNERVFDEEKKRLSKIRDQLSEIYQMRRPLQMKLF